MEERRFYFCGDPLHDIYIRENPFALLVGILAIRRSDADHAWRLPFSLRNRLDQLHPAMLVNAGERKVAAAIGQAPALHPRPETTARLIVAAARKVRDEYGSEAGRIWNDAPSAAVVRERICAFRGISRRQVQMAMRIIRRDNYVRFGTTLTV